MVQKQTDNEYARLLDDLVRAVARTREHIADMKAGKVEMPKGVLPRNRLIEAQDAFLDQTERRLAGLLWEWRVASGAK